MTGIQSVDLVAVGPPLLVAVAAIGLLVLDLFVTDLRGAAARWAVPGGALLALAGALALVAWQGWSADASRRTFCLDGGGPGGTPACSYEAGDLTLVLQAAMLLGTAVVVLLSVHVVDEARLPAGEFAFLVLASLSGALTLAAAGDLLTLLVALEVVSLPVYGLVAMRRTDGRSTEAALKLFLVSVVSAAVTLYGISLVYGVTGAVHLDAVREALADPATRMPVTALGVGLTVAGFAFKVSAVPFHFWAPDTYVGAPLPVTAYLSVVSKAAGFAGLILVLVEAFRPYADVWGPLVAVMAAVTMTVGNLVALRQREAVRLLAWSSIAQAGYMLAPLGAAATAAGRGATLSDAVGATVVYLLIYVAMNLGAFAVASVVGRERPRNLLADYRGLARRSPLVGLGLAFFLACLAGLPPGLSGLFAKVAVFRATVSGEVGWLAVVVAVNTVIGLYYYLAWAVTLFAAPAPTPAPVPLARPPLGLVLALALTAVASVGLSVAPELVFQVVPGIAAGLP